MNSWRLNMVWQGIESDMEEESMTTPQCEQGLSEPTRISFCIIIHTKHIEHKLKLNAVNLVFIVLEIYLSSHFQVIFSPRTSLRWRNSHSQEVNEISIYHLKQTELSKKYIPQSFDSNFSFTDTTSPLSSSPFIRSVRLDGNCWDITPFLKTQGANVWEKFVNVNGAGKGWISEGMNAKCNLQFSTFIEKQK